MKIKESRGGNRISLEDLWNLVSEAHAHQKYAGGPYTKHLQDVLDVLCEFGFWAGDVGTGYMMGYISLGQAALLHDILEDTSVKEEDLIKAGVSEHTIKLVKLVTDEPGDDRKTRKKKTYPKIASDKDAIILKLADRIANSRASKKAGSRHFKMYVEEYKEFKEALYKMEHIEAKEMWKELDGIYGFNPP